MAGSWLRFSPTASLLFELRDDTRATRLARLQNELRSYQNDEASGYSQRGPASTGADPDEDVTPLAREMAAVWSETSRRMHHAAARDGALYLHFLQPNQYDPDHPRAMSSEERAVAWEEGRIRGWIGTGYPMLREHVEEVRAEGVRFVDLGDLYSTHPEPIYRDLCCHTNPAGYDILARAIAEHVDRALAERSRE